MINNINIDALELDNILTLNLLSIGANKLNIKGLFERTHPDDNIVFYEAADPTTTMTNSPQATKCHHNQ